MTNTREQAQANVFHLLDHPVRRGHWGFEEWERRLKEAQAELRRWGGAYEPPPVAQYDLSRVR